MPGSAFFWKKRTATVHERIAALCKEGDALASAGGADDAKLKYIAALKLRVLGRSTSNSVSSTRRPMN